MLAEPQLHKCMDKQRVLMHGHQGWYVRHGLCHIYMIYVYIYGIIMAFVCSHSNMVVSVMIVWSSGNQE